MADTPETLIRKLRTLAASLLTKRDFRDFAQIAKLERQKNIDAGNDIHGEPFAPLAKSTVRRKTKMGSKNPEKILVDTGVLRNPKIETTDDSATITVPASRSDISEYHQKGYGSNPVREHWGITQEAEDKINDLFEDRVNEVIKKIMRSR